MVRNGDDFMIDFDKARARAKLMSLEEETEILKKSLEESGIDYSQDENGTVTILTTNKHKKLKVEYKVIKTEGIVRAKERF